MGRLLGKAAWRVAVTAGVVGIVAAMWPTPVAAQRGGGNGGGGGRRQQQREREREQGGTQLVSDQQVIDAIRRGVDYLLQAKRGDNWESHNWPKQGNKGGQTAQALYALLEVGESFKDEAYEDPRLTFRSPELAPVIAWLCKQDITETYTAAFTSLALVQLNSRSPEVQATLDKMAAFMQSSMGVEGGYVYNNIKEGPQTAGRPVPDIVKKVMAPRVLAAVALANLQSKRRELAKTDPAGAKAMDGQITAAVAQQKATEAAAQGQHYKDGWFGDISNSQYGTYGAWALDDAGFEFPLAYWKTSDAFWRKHQLANGGWGYTAEDNNLRPNMALAGIASLFITQEYTDTDVRMEPRVDKNIHDGLEWLNQNFEPKPKDTYYMYGVERIGLASGYKTFNKANWYMEGAKALIDSQNGDGSWESAHADGQGSVGTAYALLFLVRGRNPVLFNKLEYANGPWDARPRDNANIAAWLSKTFEKPINWQIVNMNVPVEDWQDAPVLLITGSKPLNFGPADVQKIRTFIEQGGMVFSTADGGSLAFTESIKALASQVVTENGTPKYEMKTLDKNDIIYSTKNELWKPISRPLTLMAMNNGVRHVWIHSPTDIGATFQGRRTSNIEHYEFIANLYRYASGKTTLRSKLQPLTIVAKGGASRAITMARVDYSGNWDPEPGAWDRQAKYMTLGAQTKLEIKPTKLINLNALLTPVAHMTGTTRFPINPGEVAALKKYLADGGTLIADAAGMSSEFRTSFAALMAEVTGKTDALLPIPSTSKLLNGTIPGSVDATEVSYRRSYLLGVAKGTSPRLFGVEMNGRYAVIYSEADITSGLLGTNTWGIMGYTPESAQELARNMVLYAADHKSGKDGLPVSDASPADK